MTGSRKLLIFGGMALAAFGMLYGLQYALFVEHQTLHILPTYTAMLDVRQLLVGKKIS